MDNPVVTAIENHTYQRVITVRFSPSAAGRNAAVNLARISSITLRSSVPSFSSWVRKTQGVGKVTAAFLPAAKGSAAVITRVDKYDFLSRSSQVSGWKTLTAYY